MYKIITSKQNQFKGLIDRRYAPISLLKRPTDYEKLVKQIKDITGRTLPDQTYRSKIIKFFNQTQTNGIDLVFPEENKGYFENIELITVQMPRSPYKALNGKERIWICNNEKNRLQELTTQSQYIEAINKEWQDFPSFYLSYLIPSVTKEELKKYKEVVFQAIAEKIALC